MAAPLAVAPILHSACKVTLVTLADRETCTEQAAGARDLHRTGCSSRLAHGTWTKHLVMRNDGQPRASQTRTPNSRSSAACRAIAGPHQRQHNGGRCIPRVSRFQCRSPCPTGSLQCPSSRRPLQRAGCLRRSYPGPIHHLWPAQTADMQDLHIRDNDVHNNSSNSSTLRLLIGLNIWAYTFCIYPIRHVPMMQL